MDSAARSSFVSWIKIVKAATIRCCYYMGLRRGLCTDLRVYLSGDRKANAVVVKNEELTRFLESGLNGLKDWRHIKYHCARGDHNQYCLLHQGWLVNFEF